MIPNFSVITMENNHHSSFYKPPPSACKVTLMCSYGGKFHPRHHDNLITYVEGEHKILCVERFIKLSALVAKLTSLTGGTDFSVKYQLPGDDLDNLVSVINDEDQRRSHRGDLPLLSHPWLFRISQRKNIEDGLLTHSHPWHLVALCFVSCLVGLLLKSIGLRLFNRAFAG